MKNSEPKAVAIVGVGAVLPQAPNARIFWQNIKEGRYSIVDVPKERWDPDLYYDPDPKVPDKSYSKIGGWVTEWRWDPLKWRMPIPPKVSDAMDLTQKWAIISTREALTDYGYPEKSLDEDRTAVILGNAMGGDIHLYTASRILFPEYAQELSKASTFSELPENLKESILEEFRNGVGNRWPEINEDTMPGELSNIIAGRIAALYNFHGPNYVADAACASAMAAISAAIEGLSENYYDAVITGGIDANMSASTYVKFCKIGALSATGTRPYAEGADGFVMGEGAAVFLIKRLADAERNGDKIYAVIRSLGGSSDGKGKGITAPNPIGQTLAVKRAWERSGLSPATASLIEGHGTSTAVGDAVELECLDSIFSGYNLNVGSIALGSVKSNIGHLKGAAGAAGMLKTAYALSEKVLPPSLNFHKPNRKIDFSRSAFSVNTELRPWDLKNGDVRRAGVSAFGFGGTNFHAVMEEYIPGRIKTEKKISFAGAEIPASESSGEFIKAPLRGALVIGGDSEEVILKRLQEIESKVAEGWVPPVAPPRERDLRASVRLAIDFGDASELTAKIEKAMKALQTKDPGMWKALKMRGVFLGKGDPQKLAFLFTGQGSQYVNMLEELRKEESVIANTFNDADKVMTPLLGKPLSKYIFVDEDNKSEVEQANKDLMQTAITQPTVLATDLALSKLFSAYGISPDIVMGHSLGEYGALVVSGAMPFDDALKAVSARGTEMTKVSVEDKGLMAAVFGPLEEIEKIVSQIDGYVVIANINSYSQVVIGGATPAVEKAMKAIQEAGFDARLLSVSHAFHTQIVAPASAPLGRVLNQLRIQPPQIPVVANVTGDFYPMGPGVEPEMVDLLAKQVASPVQFVKGLNTLYNAGARVFIEVGPKKALHGFVEDVLGKYDDITALFSNRPKRGDVLSFNQALCGLYAAGVGVGESETLTELKTNTQPTATHSIAESQTTQQTDTTSSTSDRETSKDKYLELGQLFVDFLEKGYKIYSGDRSTPSTGEAWITGASLGLPGVNGMFDDSNVERLLRGEQFIFPIPAKLREAMVAKNITRLVKTDQGGPRFETIDQEEDVIKLAARKVNLDIVNDFGYPEDRIPALDVVTAISIAAGIDALRDAGIPLVMQYKTTTKGTKLPERWILPEEMQDDTGIIFASAFPGYDSYANEMQKYYRNLSLRERLKELESLRSQIIKTDQANGAIVQIDNHIQRIETELEDNPYHFDRRFLFRVLSMGHSQFAEYIGARGPNTQINAACASTTQAVGMAKDWIQIGRCRRVIIVSADDITTDDTLEWFGAGFLATGAAATDEDVEDAAIPFDKRRHGMLVGMGGAALVVESPEAAKERGIRPICELLSSITANSAFHGTRLDLNHISQVMERLVSQAEARWGINRYSIAAQTVFVSHETYTPARGGSASAEINALRHVFGPAADKVVIANTKGFTGHAMGVGIEDVLAVKALETGIVPPVANFKEIDPELGRLNLSRGGDYPVRYSLRLGAGFGSQISMTLMRWIPNPDGAHKQPSELGFSYRIADHNAWKTWMRRISGYESPELEIHKRTLRVKDQGPVKIDFKPERAYSTPAKSLETLETNSKKMDEKQVPEPVISETSYSPPSPSRPSETPSTEKVVTVQDPVKVKVMALIEEQTGYPPDMLEMDLDLEADLGIDTVKQAEMFAAIRKEFDIPRDDNLQLRDFPTLKHVLDFVFDNRPDLKTASQVGAPAESTNKAAEDTKDPHLSKADISVTDPVQEKVLTLISEQTGYPTDMLDLELDLEADLGIDTVKQAEMFAAIRAAYDIPRDDNLQLRDFPTLAHAIQFVYDNRPDLKKPETTLPDTPVTAAGETKSRETDHKTTGVMIDGEDPVKIKVLSLISEQTGYPTDMLDLELDLEADLGIDTVKQAEMFAAIRAEYNIPRDDSLQLRDFPTLAHTIQFVYDNRPDLKPSDFKQPQIYEQPEQTPQQSATRIEEVEMVPEGDPVKQKVLSLISEQTGYPIDMLDLELDLEADLGIDTVKQAEMFAAIRAEYNIPRDDNLQLRDFPTLAHTIQFVYDNRPDLKPSDAKTTQVPEQVEQTPRQPVTDVEEAETVPSEDPVKQKVLELISEKTGYPTDMLDLDQDMEADLGIDTVKQAEMFAAIRAEYNIPRDDNLQLREFPTLAHAIQFVYNRRPDLKEGAIVEAQKSEAPAKTHKEVHTEISGGLDAVDAIPRRVPTAILRPDLKYCKSTGVILDESSRVIVMMDQGGVGKSLISKLKKKGVETLAIDDNPTTDELISRINKWKESGLIQGVYWLPALDKEGLLSDMDYKSWKEATRIRVKMLYSTMRQLYDQLNKTGTFLVSATRLGGKHGYDDAGAVAPLGGAVCGFTKTYKREQTAVLTKAVDFEDNRKTGSYADLLIQETLYDPGVVEVGYKDGLRWTIGLKEIALTDGSKGMELNKDSVFLITGAAGSIVSAITSDLAAASGGTFHLLDLVPKPDPENEDLKRFSTDKEGLKRDIFQRLKEKGERATPAIVEKEITALERSHAALTAIQAVEKAGGKAFYYSVNLLDNPGVAKTIKEIKKISKKIDVLLHAGGLEISRLLPDKNPEEFDLVFDVKSDGWFNLLSSLGKIPIGATIVFSSIAGRFGNAGQPDYSAANDFLCKSSSNFRTTRTETRGIAIDWTAWGGIGMAARGSIPSIMKQAGIEMLPPEAGIPFIRKELITSGRKDEIVVAKQLGIMLNEFDDTGGLDLGKDGEFSKSVKSKGVMVDKVTGMGLYSGLSTEVTLDPKNQPFLYDHQIDGTPVLPGVMGIEAMVEAAKLLFPHKYIAAIQKVEFMAPFKFYRNEPRTVTVRVNYEGEGNQIIASCSLVGSRKLLGHAQEQESTHFTSQIILVDSPPAPPKPVKKKFSQPKNGKKAESTDIYKLYFHGPAYQVLEMTWKSGNSIVGQIPGKLPPNHTPEKSPTYAAPRFIELCFQTAGIWEMGKTNKMGLPLHIDEVVIYKSVEISQEQLFAVVSPSSDGSFDATVIDANGDVFVTLKGYKTAELPSKIEENLLKPLKGILE